MLLPHFLHTRREESIGEVIMVRRIRREGHENEDTKFCILLSRKGTIIFAKILCMWDFFCNFAADMYPKLKNRPWKVIKSENILRLGPWLSVRQECVELPSGKQIPTWYVMEFPDWINVIAITKDGKMVMEDQYRHALGETHYELVAGVIDPGETPLQAAQRELSEETGYEGGEWSLFMTLSPNPTNHNNLSYTFLATGVEKVREQHQEETEDIHVDILDPSQVLEMLRDGEIIQALHAAPLWKYFS